MLPIATVTGKVHRISRPLYCLAVSLCLLLLSVCACAQQAFKLAPAVAVEAEDFKASGGWRVVKMGEGNYSVDIIGFSHCSGERFLSVDAKNKSAVASRDITVPAAGPYRLWVRYEYMPFTDCRFNVSIEQNGKVVAQMMMGGMDSPRLAFGEHTLRAQYDPPWGNEGLDEEVLDVPALAAGPARIYLKAIDQPQVVGRTANRNIDMLYLSGDVTDSWRKHYASAIFYPILDAFRDTIGPRYEVQFTNKGEKPMSIATSHYYNRNQFYDRQDQAATAKDLAPGAKSAWLPMPMQDTSHNGMARFSPGTKQPFIVTVRPLGGKQAEETVESPGDWVGIYLPPYPGKGEKAVSVLKEIDAVTAALQAGPLPGKNPTVPLCYGWTVPYAEDNDYGRKYAKLYAALGMRSVISGYIPDEKALSNLKAAGVDLTRSVGYIEYRFPPTVANIAKAKGIIEKAGMKPYMRWFDYGDEIAFSEWVSYMVAEKQRALNNPNLKMDDIIRPMWQEWLKQHRPGYSPADYWRAGWGNLDPAQLRPDSSSTAAQEKPRLYVDSLIFYEDTSIAFVANGMKAVKAALGDDVLCGANYSGYPFYCPSTVMYIKWFRDGAADFGRHSEYFWQLGQVTPLINGYFSEHFRAGMRFNPKAIVKQYTMPHSPGNTDASFRRTAFSHLAHGVKNMDFFGMGMNEAFTENYIDHRDYERFVAIRDITRSMALVEDILEGSQVVPSRAALLVSESTERWDLAGIANDYAGHDFGIGKEKDGVTKFRKTRLTHHQDRVGIYTALTYAGESPDVLIERDLTPEILNGYKVLYLVGDSIPASVVPAVENWVRAGGILFATAGVGRFGAYRDANPNLQRLVGIESRRLEERETFTRTAQEVPFLKPVSTVAGQGWEIPALATFERIKPIEGVTVLATFKEDGSPAVIRRDLGNGKIYYAATLPGLEYLWKGLQPVVVPDRGANAHRAVTTYDKAAASLLLLPFADARVVPMLSSDLGYLDMRLIKGNGAYILPLANYNQQVGQKVTITVRPPAGAGELGEVTSSFNGKLNAKTVNGNWVITIPKLGYGEMVRISVK